MYLKTICKPSLCVYKAVCIAVCVYNLCALWFRIIRIMDEALIHHHTVFSLRSSHYGVTSFPPFYHTSAQTCNFRIGPYAYCTYIVRCTVYCTVHSTHLFIRSILTIRTRMRVTVRGLCSLHAAHSEQCLGQRTLRAHTLTSHISHLRGPYRPVLAPGRRPWPSL